VFLTQLFAIMFIKKTDQMAADCTEYLSNTHNHDLTIGNSNLVADIQKKFSIFLSFTHILLVFLLLFSSLSVSVARFNDIYTHCLIRFIENVSRFYVFYHLLDHFLTIFFHKFNFYFHIA